MKYPELSSSYSAVNEAGVTYTFMMYINCGLVNGFIGFHFSAPSMRIIKRAGHMLELWTDNQKYHKL